MTREDALQDYNTTGVDKKIHQIFDYFESRTCIKCKYFNPSKEDMIEGNGSVWIDCDICFVESDNCEAFSCNKWEAK